MIKKDKTHIIFTKTDVFGYFALTMGIQEGVVKELLQISGVGKAIFLYMRAGLPLAAAIIYIGDALADNMSVLPERYSFIHRQQQKNQIGDHALLARPYNTLCGEVVRHLSRYVHWRLDGNIPGLPLDLPIDLNLTEYARPLLDPKTIHAWMADIGLCYNNSDYYNFWDASEDYQQYLRYWILAFFEDYKSICSETDVFDIYDIFLEEMTNLDAIYKAAPGLKTPTPFLDEGMRVSLLLGAYTLLRSGIAKQA